MAGRAQKSIGPRLAFWDTSALVPLCVRESTTPRAIALYESYETVIWWATPVEIASALARLARMKRLSSEDWAKARALAADLAQEWRVIQPSNSLRARAMELVGRYDLASGDALQLSAALDWCEGAPLGKVFLTSDQKLREAAVLTGFEGSLM
jgi:predicted nucleic acid-binding protein